MKKIIVLIFFLLLGCQQQAVIFENGQTVQVDLADTPTKRTKGLMNIEHLDENEGMLFIFEEQKQVSFWMKNTLIPLDMIFLNAEGTIVNIQNAIPCKQDPCKISVTCLCTPFWILKMKSIHS